MFSFCVYVICLEVTQLYHHLMFMLLSTYSHSITAQACFVCGH